METSEIKKPEKLLIAISALAGHGKTKSTNRLVELLTSTYEDWNYDSRSIVNKKEQLAILEKNGVPEIAIVTVGDVVDERFEDWYRIITSISTIKIIVGCCRTKHGTFDYLTSYAQIHGFTMILTHPYYQQVPALTKNSPIINYWNDLFAKQLLKLIHIQLANN